MRQIFARTKLLMAALMVMGLMAAVAPQASAANCDQRICNAVNKLHNAERKHGNNSRQVQNARRYLERARESCQNRGRRRDRDHDHDRH